MNADHQIRRAHAFSLKQGVITVTALLIAFAALDDITTGNEPNFTTEYVALVICGAVLIGVAVQLLRARRQCHSLHG